MQTQKYSYKSKQLALLPQAVRDEILSCRSVEELNAYKNDIQMHNQTMELNDDKQVHRITLPVGHLDLLMPVDSKTLMGGNVEQFLEMLEAQIQTSLKVLMKSAIPKIDVNKIDTEDASFTQLPLQIFTTAYYVGFTSQLQKAMDEGKLEEVVAHFKNLEQSFIGLMLDNWSEPLRQRLMTLLTVVVAFYELSQRLHKAGDMTEECNELWKDTPRWVFDGEKVQVKTFQTSRFQGSAVKDFIDYGYHLIGFQNLLVHTALSWKVYSGIVSCNVGVMGSKGPAGTGKTESIKDFGNLCGIKLLVYKASDQMTEEDIVNLHDYCDATHSVVIDEFNRIPAEVTLNESGKLAVLGQTTSPQDGKFRISSVPHFRFFITMNPGMSGGYNISEDDSKLPVEWIVPMTIPDYADILHIMLATKGFFNAKTLGFKLAACLNNLKETNKMWHHDFGLRAAKSVCEAAGKVRRADPSLDESLAISIALYKTIGARFPVADRESLAAYITTTFVGPNQQSKAQVQNYTNCRQICIVNSPWLTFWETKDLRHGNMLLTKQDTFEFGNSLATWLNALQVQKCSAFAMTQGTPEEMFGTKNTSGVYEQFFRKAAEEKDTQHFLIVTGKTSNNEYGHDFNTHTFEPLNTVMDDNKMLILENEVKVPMPPNARLVFVANHQGPKLSPASVSRMGFVCY